MSFAEIVAVVGVGLAGAGLLWTVLAPRLDRKRRERQAAADLVGWLAGRRVLWNPIIKEIPEEAVASVGQIRERVDTDSGRFQSSEARAALNSIREACLALLDSPRDWWRTFFSVEAEAELRRFRQSVRPAIETLAAAYEILPPEWPDFTGGFEGPEVEIYVRPPDDVPGA